MGSNGGHFAFDIELSKPQYVNIVYFILYHVVPCMLVHCFPVWSVQKLRKSTFCMSRLAW